MANKKLRLEVELDIAKAKQKKKELEAESPGASVSTGSTPASSRAAREIRELGDAAHGAKVNMKEVTRAFSGMAVGLAASYAAKSMRPGAARDAVEYGGAAMTGANIGMMAGPKGAAVGALGGLLMKYIEKQGEKNQMSEDFEKGEKIYAATKKKNDRLLSLTDVKPEQYESSIAAMKEDLDNYVKSSEDLVERIREELKSATPDKEKVADLRRNLDFNRAQIERYEQAIRSMENLKEKQKGDPRASMTGTDSLAKIGGTSSRTSVASLLSETPKASVRTAGFSFGFSNSARASTMTFGGPSGGDSVDRAIKTADECQARRDEQMQRSLDEIAKNTKKGDAWQ